MTALCSGGPSQPKTGQNPFVILAADRLVNFVSTGGMAWLEFWAAAMGSVSFHLPDFCAVDPPALPNIDAPRIASWVLPPDGAVKLREDMAALVGHFFWFTACECVAGPQPTPPSPVANPPGYDLNPPRVAPPVGPAQCDSKAWFQTVTLDSTGSLTVPMFNTVPLVDGITSLLVEWYGGFPGGGTYPISYTLLFQSNNRAAILGSYTYAQTHAWLNTQPQYFTTSVPPGTKVVDLQVVSTGSANQSVGLNHTLSFSCGTGPPGEPTLPCCPPDPVMQQLLFQIYATVQQILADLAGEKQPYVDSTVHQSLINSGSIPISPKSKAIRVDVITRPSNQPVNPGDPNYFFDLGFITPFALGTPLRGQRLLYDHQIYEYPTYTDQVGYTLPAGVTINLVELVT